MQNQAKKLQQLLLENAIGVEDFAYCLGIEPIQAEALTQGRRKVSAALARQIEQTFSKPSHWLDADVQSGVSDYDLFG